MSDRKIVIPEGMLKAVNEASFWTTHRMGFTAVVPLWIQERMIEAALQWFIENLEKSPNANRMPEDWYSVSRLKWEKFSAQWPDHRNIPFLDLLIFFGHRLNERFLSPEPEVPEEIKDLMMEVDTPGFGLEEDNNRNVIEAFRRGQKSIK